MHLGDGSVRAVMSRNQEVVREGGVVGDEDEWTTSGKTSRLGAVIPDPSTKGKKEEFGAGREGLVLQMSILHCLCNQNQGNDEEVAEYEDGKSNREQDAVSDYEHEGLEWGAEREEGV